MTCRCMSRVYVCLVICPVGVDRSVSCMTGYSVCMDAMSLTLTDVQMEGGPVEEGKM